MRSRRAKVECLFSLLDLDCICISLLGCSGRHSGIQCFGTTLRPCALSSPMLWNALRELVAFQNIRFEPRLWCFGTACRQKYNALERRVPMPPPHDSCVSRADVGSVPAEDFIGIKFACLAIRVFKMKQTGHKAKCQGILSIRDQREIYSPRKFKIPANQSHRNISDLKIYVRRLN